MRAYLLLVVVLVSLAPALSATELITNGAFEEDLDIGWTQEVSGSAASITRDTYHEPDFDYEVYLSKGTGAGYAHLSQTVDLPGLDAVVSARLKLTTYATETAWAASALVIAYLDAAGEVLGETYICDLSRYCPWESGTRMHVVEVDPAVWETHSFVIEDELTHLAAIDPMDVKAVEITLLTHTYDC